MNVDHISPSRPGIKLTQISIGMSTMRKMSTFTIVAKSHDSCYDPSSYRGYSGSKSRLYDQDKEHRLTDSLDIEVDKVPQTAIAYARLT